ncbi:DUF262 domain-containing protein [Acidovorax sp. CCYZU-2555]|uniref:DUF262 domain-containing protein n=1 Tax=Acidovorax sp. CCYZU-2555 TaxID=2835042 RepID=UPI001BCD2A9F|nr:DUF262 domain-containing protein [Acidovorax sp. CCYZU-2555]MBS7780078.1 DUF262 domain-containing protein [Acidovorax sp. CCYZU-2555]
MNNDQLNPQLLTVSGLFENEAVYTVPVYQRNYAWRIEQIEQLISDIHDASREHEQGYFLGNLVTQPTTQGSGTNFEVVDGQQRLTTLYLLLTFLESDGARPFTLHRGKLQYESRARATETLRHAGLEGSLRPGQDGLSHEDSGIHEGFNVIQQMFRQHKELRNQDERSRFADYLRTQVTVVRASLPPATDLNRYFEVMNTRGQQLEQVDIVKARLMSKLPESEHSGFAWIWDACADMDSYVQMALTRDNPVLRSAIFGDNWSWLQCANFQALIDARPTVNTATKTGTALSIDDALRKYASSPQQDFSKSEVSERFRSSIGFSVFLLHVLKVKNNDAKEDEGQLDDKRLIRSFTEAIPADREASWVREFIFTLLKCRNLFDSFILKRQFVTSTQNEEGDWSLQRLKKRSRGPGYVHLFSNTDTESEEDGDDDMDTREVLLLQSMLRITYTSPRTMHWITKALQKLAAAQDPGAVPASDLVNLLKAYARGKVKAAFFSGEQPQGFDIGRIVFTYLDYLLLQSTRQSFKFQFRNSIEHFYPQRPDREQTGMTVSQSHLNLLGNLALVSVSANSKFSNNIPKTKADSFKDTIEIQSPKLRNMAEITRNEGWGDEQVKKHHENMVKLLQADIDSN